jgi:hypothetical protein
VISIIMSEIPQTRLVVVASHEEHSLSWGELWPVNISITTVGLSHKYNALFFISFEGNYRTRRVDLTTFELLLIGYSMGASISCHLHALEVI